MILAFGKIYNIVFKLLIDPIVKIYERNKEYLSELIDWLKNKGSQLVQSIKFEFSILNSLRN